MRASTLLLSAATLALVAGCAYKSSFKQTNFDVEPPPVAGKNVKVAKSADDVSGEWVELGRFRGRAPSDKELLDAAKFQCGKNGANLVIYADGPTTEGGSVELEAICGYKGAAAKKGSGKGKKI